MALLTFLLTRIALGEKEEDWIKSAEIVNGLQLGLTVRSKADGTPKLVIHFRNGVQKSFDIVEHAPMFLEVLDVSGGWRTFQHPRWGSSKVDTCFTFEPGHHETEVEPVSAFTVLPPGTYRARVSMALDRGILKLYKSKQIWTGVIRSNSVAFTITDKRGV